MERLITCTDAELALRLATAAGDELLRVRAATAGRSPREVRDAGDHASQRVLAELLRKARPDDAVLSEEAGDGSERLRNPRVWIIDPLDGTREFADASRNDWAVHVALWEAGCLSAGAVVLPADGLTYGTQVPARRPQGRPARIRLAVSRSRPPSFIEQLAEHLDAELVPMGSAGFKATAVLRDEADAYVHAGGQYEWDSAAPVAVCRASGLHTSRINGSRLIYNRPDPMLPDLLVCRPEISIALLEAIATLHAEVTVTT